MSTAPDLRKPATPPKPGSPKDPFFYGYRDIPVLLPDGSHDFKRVPLTPEDVLHPRFGDKIVLGHPHSVDCNYLCDLFRAKVADDPSAVVLSDTGIFWDDRKLRHHAPDVAVIFGVRERQEWATFRVPREGVRPSLIVEITSVATRGTDLGRKVEQYALARVPHYIVVDAGAATRRKRPRRIQLIEYRPGPSGAYERQPARPDGRIWLDAVRLWLGKAPADYGERVACFDPETGREIGDYGQVTNDLKHARVDARKAQADARKAQADAEAERQARMELEAKLRAMEEKFRRLGGPDGDG